jgi:dihydrofolate synthase/folylpolyglutamate synthase
MYFLQQDCNIVVLEVGLGGRLDATNVITTTECAVITSISMDHMNILGNNIEQIALEKAGIIKPGISVVSYQQAEEVRKVIELVSDENHASLETADFNKIEVEKQGLNGTTFSYDEIRKVQIRLLGEYQVKNAVTAILAVKAMRRLGYNISEEDIQTGLYQTSWTGRFEIIRNKPLFLIDGAHNDDAALELAKNIEMYFSNKRILYILGVLADKDYDAILKRTGSYAERIITITPNNSRGLPSDKLAQTAKKYCSNVIDAGDVTKAIEKAYEAAGQDDVIIAFGSLSYLKEVYEYFGNI